MYLKKKTPKDTERYRKLETFTEDILFVKTL